MNRKLLGKLVSIALFPTISGVGWAAPVDSYPVTYLEALRAALKDRNEIAIEVANVQRSKASVQEAKGAFLPTLDLTTKADRITSYNDYSGVSVNARFEDMDIPVSVTSETPKHQVTPGVELRYNLYAGGGDEAKENDARARARAAQGQLALTKRQIALDITASYWELRKAQVAVQIALDNRDYAREDLNLFTKSYENGKSARIELDSKVVSLEFREIDLKNAERKLVRSHHRYLYALGRNDVGLSSARPLALVDQANDISIEAVLQELGIPRNIELDVASAELQSTEAQIRQIKAEYKPSVDLYIRHTGIGRDDKKFGSAWSDLGRDATFIGVSLKWNLFDGFRSDQRLAQSRLISEQARLRLAQVKRNLQSGMQEDRFRAAEMYDQLRLAEKQRDLSQQQLLVAKERLDTQMISPIQYYAAELELKTTIKKVALAEIDLLLAKVTLHLQSPD